MNINPNSVIRKSSYNQGPYPVANPNRNKIKIDMDGYSLNASMKNTEDKNEVNNMLTKLIVTPIYLNLDSFNIPVYENKILFNLLETYKSIESIKLIQVILPFIATIDYSDIYLSIEEFRYGYFYNDNYYLYNLFADTPSTYTPGIKVITEPLKKKFIFDRVVDNINTLTFQFRDTFYKKINFPKSVICATIVPNTNPLELVYTNHGLLTGDLVIICNAVFAGEYTITYIDDNTFSIPYDGTLLNDPCSVIVKIYKFRILLRLIISRFNGN